MKHESKNGYMNNRSSRRHTFAVAVKIHGSFDGDANTRGMQSSIDGRSTASTDSSVKSAERQKRAPQYCQYSHSPLNFSQDWQYPPEPLHSSVSSSRIRSIEPRNTSQVQAVSAVVSSTDRITIV